MKLRAATTDLCLISLLCFHSTFNGIERSSPSHHPINVVLLFGVYIYIYIYLTNRFHVAMRLFSNRSQMTPKCGKNKKVAHEAQPSVSLMFLRHFDVLCDLLLSRHTAKWNLFVLYNKELEYTEKKPFFFQISPL